MGILDDAIKEHLELKRQHGAAEDELKQLEDEAFGAAERPGGEDSAPDPLAEAPTQFMTQPDLEEPSAPDPLDAGAEEAPPGRRAEIADVQEPPQPEAEIPTGPTTEEREAIAEQPTEMFDVEEELSASQVEEAPAEEPEQVEVEDEYEEDDDFWDEKRLSDELDQALEAPVEVEEDVKDEEALYEDASTEAEDEPESEHPPSSGDDEEDVLEETPDFLEETPEDDQLWFEQKPPKDFDFDD